MALIMLLTVFFCSGADVFGSAADLIFAILFLSVLPVLAYPMQKFIPSYKDKGREGQRNLAIIFAVAGYVLGCIAALITRAPAGVWIIYLEYLFSGLGIFIFNKAFKIKASGHACGVAGPAILLAGFGIYCAAIPAAVIFGLVVWSSLRMKRHTAPQLIAGTIIPAAVYVCLRLIFGFAGLI